MPHCTYVFVTLTHFLSNSHVGEIAQLDDCMMIALPKIKHGKDKRIKSQACSVFFSVGFMKSRLAKAQPSTSESLTESVTSV